MSEKTIFSMVDEKGREFKLIGDLDSIQKEIANLQNMTPEEYKEEGYVYWDSDERVRTQDDIFKEIVDVSAYFDEDFDWTDIINNMPRKKNGTFHKNRVRSLHRTRSFSLLLEDHYGYSAPEVRIKSINDLEAMITLEWTVENW